MGFYVSLDTEKRSYYCLMETIYESSNSTIYKGFSNISQQEVVLKCFENAAHGAFLREMADFGISHPHLIQYLDTFYFGDDKPCIVYPWYASSLEQWLQQNGLANQDFCLKCLEDLLQALVYLNSLGRIHCDIKPHNVFIHFDLAGKPHFLLGDLGATCSLREAQETRYTVSTPAYMAPERLHQRFYFNSDLYSLGIMAYELCVGHRPFEGTPEKLSRSHLSEQPNLEVITNSLLRDFIGQLLEKNPAARIQNAEIALYMLYGLTGQSGSQLPNQDLPDQQPEHLTGHDRRIIPTGFAAKANAPANFPPNKVMAFQDKGDLVIGLEYDNYVELWNLGTSKQRLLIKVGNAQAVDGHCLVFATSTKLVKFQIADESEQCLLRFNEASNYFFTDYGYLLLSNKYRNTYYDLHRLQDLHFSQTNYFSDSHADIFPDGNFCMCGGPFNQQLYWRDKQTQILGQWELHGPIVGLTCSNDTALVLTLDMQNTSRYMIWAIKLDTPPIKQELTGKVTLHNHTKGYFFWLTADKQLFMCGIDLVIITIGKLPGEQAVEAFCLTDDHRWLITVSSGLDKRSIIDCYQAYGDYLYV